MPEHLSLHDAHTKGFALVQEHTARMAGLVRSLDADEVGSAVPGSSWTVGEVVVHLRTVYERYTVDRRRAATPADVAAFNQQDVGRTDVDMAGAADSMEAQVAVLAEVVDGVPPELEFPFHGGQTITMAGGWGNLLGELLAHGDDIAAATGRSFGIPGADLEVAWRYTFPVLAGWLRTERTGVDEVWDLRFPFGSVRLGISPDGLLHENEPTADPPPGAVHRIIEADDPADLMLQVPYRRRAILDPAVALLASRFHDV